MKLLVLAANYPRPDGSISMQYIHTRNKWYLKHGIQVTVISFASKADYILDGVQVYTLKTYEEKFRQESFDILVSHAPNIKDHYRFLKKYGDNFENIVFFFHGHEVLRTSKVYPKPHSYVKKKPLISRLITEVYDCVKLIFWKKYFIKVLNKAQFVYVSNWMYDMFMKYIGIDAKKIEGRKHIIYNSIGEIFEKEYYDVETDKIYDFITIRSDLDGAKYGVDIVTRIASTNPQYRFCVIGKGEFFRYNNKPNNLEWIDKNLSHGEIIDFLNRAKCALIPTRTDAQGVMACEMATFGIPLITSNIDVCKEVFSDFTNVCYIDNDEKEIDIGLLLKRLVNAPIKKNKKYFSSQTIDKEVELFRKVMQRIDRNE